MLSAMSQLPITTVISRLKYARFALAASVAFALVASTARAEAPADGASAATLAALKPLAEAIGGSRKLQIEDAPVELAPIVFSDESDAPVAASDFKGKVVLLNFWATWCPPCLEEMPSLDRLQAELGGEDFEVVAVNLDLRGKDRPLGWMADNDVTHLAFYHDRSQKSPAAVGAGGMPTTLLIDRSGREVGRLEGAAEWDSEEAKEIIRLLIAGAPDAG